MWPKSASVGRTQPFVGQHCQHWAKIADVGRELPSFGQLRPNSANNWPNAGNLVQRQPILDSKSNVSTIGQLSDDCWTTAELAKIARCNFSGRVSSKFRKVRATCFSLPYPAGSCRDPTTVRQLSGNSNISTTTGSAWVRCYAWATAAVGRGAIIWPCGGPPANFGMATPGGRALAGGGRVESACDAGCTRGLLSALPCCLVARVTPTINMDLHTHAHVRAQIHGHMHMHLHRSMHVMLRISSNDPSLSRRNYVCGVSVPAHQCMRECAVLWG